MACLKRKAARNSDVPYGQTSGRKRLGGDVVSFLLGHGRLPSSWTQAKLIEIVLDVLDANPAV
jgi:hypothetical protein